MLTVANWTPEGDLEAVTDCLETITITALDSAPTIVTNARRAEQASGDVVWRIPVADHLPRPEEGGTVTDRDGRTLPIKQTQLLRCGADWRITTGTTGTTITEDELTDLLDILRPTFTKDVHASAVPTFIAHALAQPAKIELDAIDTDVTHGQRVPVPTYTIHMIAAAMVDTTHHLQHADGRRFKVLSVDYPNPPAGLAEIQAQIIPWPMA